MEKYIAITPVVASDMAVLEQSIPSLIKYLPVKKLIIIGDEKVCSRLQEKEMLSDFVEFLNENSILSLPEVREVIRKLSEGNELAVKRAGWYLQQFIKMKYAEICEDSYYIVWDADTIPLQEIKMFNGERPIFDMKDEYNKPYFDTMSKLIPDLKKLEMRSFISEHMLIHTESMKELIAEIEKNQADDTNKPFWYIVLSAIERGTLQYSGFSEFETYGNYCQLRKRGFYELSEYKSLREGNAYFGIHKFSEREATWVGKTYMAVSFEKTMKLYPEHVLYKCGVIQLLFKFQTLYIMRDGLERLWKRFVRKIVSLNGEK